MNFFSSFSEFIIWSADFLWEGQVLVALLLGSGIYFSFKSRFTPILYFGHALKLSLDKRKTQKGISSFESVSSQISGIVGMGLSLIHI